MRIAVGIYDQNTRCKVSSSPDRPTWRLDIASSVCILARQAKKTTENAAREVGDRYIGRQDDGFTILADSSPIFSFACNLFRGMASCDEEICFLGVQILVQAGSRIVGKDVSSLIQLLKAEMDE